MKRFIRFLPVAVCVTSLACETEAGPGARSQPDTAARRTEVVAAPDPGQPVAAPTSGSEPAVVSRTPAFAPDTGRTPLPPPQQEDGARLLAGAAARYGTIRAMRADFIMEARNPLLREAIRSRGELYQRRPDRILLKFEDPAGDVIVSDGRYIWVWYPSLDSAQVLRTPAATGAGGVDLLAQFVGDPTERFRWSQRADEVVDGRSAAILVLDPRGEEAYRQLVVWIDRADFLVRRFEVTEHSGLVRRIDLIDLVINPDLPDSLFQFVPPAGARIVGRP